MESQKRTCNEYIKVIFKKLFTDTTCFDESDTLETNVIC